MGKQTIRIRRVGSVTFGTILILTGVLFLIHLLFPSFRYVLIYRFWPVILIMLGIEVLAGSRYRTYEILDEQGKTVEQSKVVYDVAAILLMIAVTGFVMVMALAEWVFYETQTYICM